MSRWAQISSQRQRLLQDSLEAGERLVRSEDNELAAFLEALLNFCQNQNIQLEGNDPEEVIEELEAWARQPAVEEATRDQIRQFIEMAKKMVFKMLDKTKKTVTVDDDDEDSKEESLQEAQVRDFKPWKDPLKWIAKRDLDFDVNYGASYIPSAEVLGNRERSRQQDEMVSIGTKLFGNQFGYEYMTNGLWMTYRDNRDNVTHGKMQRKLADAMKRAGYKPKLKDYHGQLSLTVPWRKDLINKVMKIHPQYVAMINKKRGIKEWRGHALPVLEEGAKPDFKKAAEKLLKQIKGKDQASFHQRAYLRAVIQGNKAQATHMAKNVMDKKAAAAIRDKLIDLAGMAESALDERQKSTPTLAFSDEEKPARKGAFKVSSKILKMWHDEVGKDGPSNLLFKQVRDRIERTPYNDLPKIWGKTNMADAQDVVSGKPKKAFQMWLRNIKRIDPKMSGYISRVAENVPLVYYGYMLRVVGKDMADIIFKRYFETESGHAGELKRKKKKVEWRGHSTQRPFEESVGSTIWKQIDMATKMATGAREPAAGTNDLTFKVDRKPYRFVRVHYNKGKDLYSIEYFRMKRGTYEKITIAKMDDVGVENLNSTIYGLTHGKIK